LKAIYHNDAHWSECYQKVAERFTLLKKIARKFYAGKTEVEMLSELTRYSKDDINDMAESELVGTG
jgi:predicted nuclease of restriction endonuclease-like RecB superfamily